MEAVYRGVGAVLARYTTGRLPKAFKVIPNLRNWEEVLYLTDPERWSPHAVFQATRLFVSNLNARMAQRFVALVLLPAVRAGQMATGRGHVFKGEDRLRACVFWGHPATDSESIRPPIPILSGHRFRSIRPPL